MASTEALSDVVVGYPKLAAKIELLPEYALFRRCGALNAQNLLYYQAELTYLERKLKMQQVKDNTHGNRHEKSCAVDWFWLERSQAEESSPQLDSVLKIRKVLKDYNEVLIQQSTILQYPKPESWDLRYVQNCLQLPEMGECALEGLDATIWGSVADRKSYKPDLVMLRPRAKKKDPFSKWAARNAISILFKLGCARFVQPSRRHVVGTDTNRIIYEITYWITVILAAPIPIASIAVLNEVQLMSARLALIAAFNVLFSICLIGFTDAKTDQVFAINAAFAAVQVVFVGQDNCPKPS